MEEMINGGNQTAEEQQTAEQTTETTPAAEQQAEPMFKIKYNHEEKEIPYSQAVELAQKGMNYDHVYEELEQLRNNPGLAYLNKQAQQYNMTVEQLIEAYQQQEEQEQLNQLIQHNIPPEYAQEMLENRKFREQYQAEREAIQQQKQQEQQYQEFMSAYPDVKPDEIPPEVWQNVQQGRSLLDAYTQYENKTLREKLNTLQTKEQAAAANQANAQSSTGSVKGQGLPDSGYISKEVYEANKHDQSWMMKNYDTIKKSMGKWR